LVSKTNLKGYSPPITISRSEFLVDGSDSEFRTNIYALQFCAGRLFACREAFGRKIHLTPNQFVVLMSVARTQIDEGITIKELAEHASLASTHVTTEVGRLVEEGLLKKSPGKKDKRQVLVSLTSKGVDTIERVSSTIQQVNDMLFRGIDAKSFQIVGRVVRKIAENSRDALRLMKIGKDNGAHGAGKAGLAPSVPTSRVARIPSQPDSRLALPHASAHSAPGRKSMGRSPLSRKKVLVPK
jgi:DNA-binding MarR family transcriptional regulator